MCRAASRRGDLSKFRSREMELPSALLTRNRSVRTPELIFHPSPRCLSADLHLAASAEVGRAVISLGTAGLLP